MRRALSRRFWMPMVAIALLMGAARASAAVDRGQIVCGNARFTVVTANCIRLEYEANGKFVDERSYFAVNRDARDAEARIKPDGDGAVIDTAVLHLVYKPDGREFDAGNLSISLRKGDATVVWHPGMEAGENLGGTAQTLDGWDGARELPDGVLTRDGWYLLNDSETPLLTADWVRDRTSETEKDAGTDWYFFGYGDDYKAALRSLTAIGGNVPLPRRYLLGAWYSRYWPYSAKQFRGIVDEYAGHAFPLDVLVIDMDWHITELPGSRSSRPDQFWTGYTWDRKLIPDGPLLLKWLHERGLAVTLNDHPADGVWPHEDSYGAFMHAMGADASKRQHLLFDAGDKKYLDTFFDYTHVPMQKEGVDFWWLDWQQQAMTSSVRTLTNLQWLNQYYFQRSEEGGKRGVSFSRWAGWGDQRHPIHFSGDAYTTFRMLAFEVPFTATAGNAGCFFWSHDIGGHQGGRNEESYTRWCQFGAFSAALRSHSTRNATMDRRPWTYAKWAEDSMQLSFRLRSRFFPYIYSAAQESSAESVPLLRPMYLEFPRVEAAYHQPQQYLYGDDILVAPIAEPGIGERRLARQAVWFPPGVDWYDFFTGQRFDGGSEALVAADIDEFPLYVRAGTPICMRAVTQRMATDPLKELVVRCYPGADGATGSSELYEDDGLSDGYVNGQCARTKLICGRIGDQFTISIDGTEGTYSGQMDRRSYVIELPCMSVPSTVTINGKAGRADYDAKEGVVRVSVPAQSIRESCTVGVTGKVLSNDVVAKRAFARRAGLGEPAEGDTINSLLVGALDEALKNADGGDEAVALAAAAGAGVYFKNDNVYGYPSTKTAHVYEPGGMDVHVTPVEGGVTGAYTVVIEGREIENR
jgi:alpha-glucosidase (family GH31 glycosyl hydrolase)